MDVWKKNTISFCFFFLGSNADQRRGSWELEHVCWKSSHQLRRGFDQKPRRALSPWYVPVWLCETSWQLWYHEHTPSEQNVHPSALFYTAPTAPLFPYWNGSGVSGSGPQTNTVDTQGSWSYHVTLQVFLTFRNITGVFQSYPPQRLCLRNERCHCQKLETAKLMWNCSRSFLFISHVTSNLRI